MPRSSKPSAKKTTALRKKPAKPSRTPAATRASRSRSGLADETPSAATRELSGGIWVARFKGSKSLDDLKGNFQATAKAFLQALADAGANVTIAATFRPPERAYLMHFAWEIAHGNISPRDVPAMAGVAIEWVHGNAAASRAAAQEMVDGYGMAFIAALRSRHTEGRAIDMSISWLGRLDIRNAQGQVVAIATTPRTGANPRLHDVGRSYGVVKLVSDPPHWSSDGH